MSRFVLFCGPVDGGLHIGVVEARDADEAEAKAKEKGVHDVLLVANPTALRALADNAEKTESPDIL